MKYSLTSYRSIITKALSSGYTFSAFSLDDLKGSQRIYLRHDIDYSPLMALELARVNADLGVAGTFFVLLHSHSYNLLSAGVLATVREIHSLGQHIAFHSAIPSSGVDDVEVRLRNDFQLLQTNYLPMISPLFSWHNPTPEIMEKHLSMDRVGGLINAYSATFIRDIGYFSDSNMRHSPEYLLSLFDKPVHSTIQLLLHPLIWVAGGSAMREVFAGTWPYLIRQQEQEMRYNLTYQSILPSGTPEEVLQGFSKSWDRSVDEQDQ